MKKDREKELAEHNGKNGRSSYLACKGKYMTYLQVFFGKMRYLKFSIMPE
jgi:predicted heme/steroid binding protein